MTRTQRCIALIKPTLPILSGGKICQTAFLPDQTILTNIFISKIWIDFNTYLPYQYWLNGRYKSDPIVRKPTRPITNGNWDINLLCNLYNAYLWNISYENSRMLHAFKINLVRNTGRIFKTYTLVLYFIIILKKNRVWQSALQYAPGDIKSSRSHRHREMNSHPARRWVIPDRDGWVHGIAVSSACRWLCASLSVLWWSSDAALC